jgi:hypothetical protein
MKNNHSPSARRGLFFSEGSKRFNVEPLVERWPFFRFLNSNQTNTNNPQPLIPKPCYPPPSSAVNPAPSPPPPSYPASPNVVPTKRGGEDARAMRASRFVYLGLRGFWDGMSPVGWVSIFRGDLTVLSGYCLIDDVWGQRQLVFCTSCVSY